MSTKILCEWHFYYVDAGHLYHKKSMILVTKIGRQQLKLVTYILRVLITTQNKLGLKEFVWLLGLTLISHFWKCVFDAGLPKDLSRPLATILVVFRSDRPDVSYTILFQRSLTLWIISRILLYRGDHVMNTIRFKLFE